MRKTIKNGLRLLEAKKNVGKIDRIIRIIFGLGLLSLTFLGPKTLWGLIGIIPLVTASFKFCPFYPLIGLDTCSMEGKNK